MFRTDFRTFSLFRRLKRLLLLLAVMTLTAAIPAQAASYKRTTPYRAKKYTLTNVLQTPLTEGSWEEKTSGRRFVLPSGKTVKNRWVNDGTAISYVDKKGRQLTGWVLFQGDLYKLDRNGVIVTGWSGKYYLDPLTGKSASGLTVIDGEKYYFSPRTGKPVTGFVKVKKALYYFTPKTYRAQNSGFFKVKKKTCYARPNGKLYKKKWLTMDGKKYYFDEKGIMATGDKYIKGKYYHFSKSGVYDPKAKDPDAVDPKKPMVALTFDDGPGPYTSTLLDTLQKYHARATFFMVGNRVGSSTSVVKRMKSLRCELGNHSWSHPRMTSLSAAQISSQITSTSNAIYNACSSYPTVCRLPYGDGAQTTAVLTSLGLPSIYWSLDTRDWANTGNPQHTVNAVLNSVKNGDIVLMHDIHSASVTAAKTIIPALINKGYQLVTVSQLARYKGKTSLAAGHTYYRF